MDGYVMVECKYCSHNRGQICTQYGGVYYAVSIPNNANPNCQYYLDNANIFIQTDDMMGGLF